MMKQTLTLFILIVLAFCEQAHGASFVVEKATIRLKAPQQPVISFPAAIGDFGVPKYGAIMSGTAYFSPENAQGCSEHFTKAPLPSSNLSTILLVDRGSCYFVEKAWHAQNLAHANAILVADDKIEDLLTMASPETLPSLAQLVEKIIIPTLLISKTAGDTIKSLLQQYPGQVLIDLDWQASMTNPDQQVEYELWFTSNSACGSLCTEQQHFLQQFKALAMSFEQQKFTSFTPHVMLQRCYYGYSSCDYECTRQRRYCAVEPIPEQYKGQYNGADVVTMNTRHLCAFVAAKEAAQPWQWWEYASAFATNCTMETKRFDAQCAEEQLIFAGIDPGVVNACVGDPTLDEPHPILEEQLYQQRDEDNTGRGAVIMLPTVVINRDQYRGTLTVGGVLRALCSGFAEGTEPPQCLAGGLERDECVMGTHDCWMYGEWSACVDTFRGYVCRCPQGWEGDGRTCTDIDECALGIHGCDEICINDPGTYHCECDGIGKKLIGGRGQPGVCIPNSLGQISSQTHLPMWLVILLFGAMAMLISAASVAWYRQRMRNDMYGEIRAIMREYIPLDSTGDDDQESGGGGNRKYGRFMNTSSMSGGRCGGEIEEQLVGSSWRISSTHGGGGNSNNNNSSGGGGTEMVGGRK